MSRQIRITIDDDEVFERLKRRKDALDLSWEDALRRGLRDSPEPPRAPETPSPPDPPRAPDPPEPPQSPETRSRGGHRDAGRGSDRSDRRDRSRRGRGSGDPSPFDADFGERIARKVISSVSESVGESVGATVSIDDEIDRLEDAEDAVLVLGEDQRQHVPLRVALHTGPDGLEVDVVAVRRGKGTEGMNRFAGGARADVAETFAKGETARLELADGQETYDVRPDLTWARGDDGTPTVTDVTVQEVVFED